MAIFLRCVAVLFFLVLLPVPVPAEVLFVQAPALIASDTGNNQFSLPGTSLAQSFYLPTPSSLQSLRFYVGFDPLNQSPSAITWGVHQGGSDGPGALLFTGQSNAGMQLPHAFMLSVANQASTAADLKFYFDLNLEGIRLDAGGYWLSLHVDEQDGKAGDIRWLQASGTSAASLDRLEEGWKTGGHGLALLIDGHRLPAGDIQPSPIPEPATVLLLGLGLLFLASKSQSMQKSKRAYSCKRELPHSVGRGSRSSFPMQSSEAVLQRRRYEG